MAVSYVGTGVDGGDQSPSMSLRNEASTTPAAPQPPEEGDPGLTVLQPPVSQSQVASAIPPYSTMLPGFGHYTNGEYTYTHLYNQPGILIFHYVFSSTATNSLRVVIIM